MVLIATRESGKLVIITHIFRQSFSVAKLLLKLMEERPMSEDKSSLPVIQLPPDLRRLSGYEDIHFHLAQSDSLSTAFEQTYGKQNHGGERRLYNFLERRRNFTYLSDLEKKLFSQWGTVCFNTEMGSFYSEHQTDKNGCLFLASLMPKYCKNYRQQHGETTDVYKVWLEEDRIITSFVGEIFSLRRRMTDGTSSAGPEVDRTGLMKTQGEDL